MLAVVALHVFPPAIFALIHGSQLYRWGGIITFFAIILIIGNVFETLGVRTGFPFGHYYFTDLMGPKLGVVPIMLGVAYIGTTYLSWTLACLIIGRKRILLHGLQFFILPVVASCIMVSWDVSQDPVWSTVLHAWVWEGGGMYFGVPLSNFFGWFLTVYVIYELYALYLFRQRDSLPILPTARWRQAVLFYGTSAAGNLLLLLPQNRYSVAIDATGTQWSVAAITQTCAVATIFTMGIFTIMAWWRMNEDIPRGGT
jgi:hypothetical protein